MTAASEYSNNFLNKRGPTVNGSYLLNLDWDTYYISTRLQF